MSLIATKLQPYIVQNAQLDKNEHRSSLTGVTKAFLESTPVSPFAGELQSVMEKASSVDVKMPVLPYSTPTIADTDWTCTIVPAERTSEFYVFTKAKRSFEFTMFPAQFGENYMSYERVLNANLKNHIDGIAKELELLGIATLEANKNQFWTGIAPDFYAQVANDIQVPQAQKNDFYNNLSAMFMRMDFRGDIRILTNAYHMPTLSYAQAQGQANNTNLAFQFNNFQWKVSNSIPNAAGVQSTLYAYEQGSLGIAFTQNPDALAGHSIADGFKEWSVQNIPVEGIGTLPMSVYYQSDCANGNATTGRTDLTATKVESWKFMIQPTFATIYNSDLATRYNPILKAEITVA